MKIMKLSLISAIAIAGVSGANAKNLVETLHEVDISGTVNIRYNDYQNSITKNYYKVATNIKSKVSENVLFSSRIIIGDDTNSIGFSSSEDSDENIDITLSQMNFKYVGFNNTTLSLGKSSISTPFTIAKSSVGDEQVGTGITLSTKLGNITLNAGYYNQTNFDNSGNVKSLFTNNKGSNFMYLGAKTTLGNVTIDATYAEAQDVLDAYTLGISSKNKISDVQLKTFARYSSLSKDTDDNKNTLWKVGAKAKMGIFGAFVAYGETNEEGGTVGIDEGSTVGFDEHWGVTLTGTNDASTLYASINAQVLPKLNLALKYSDLKAGSQSTGVNQNEIYAQAVYKMNSNLKGYVRFGQYDKDGSDTSTRGRVNIQYSF
jgi:predicted porin